MLSGLRHDGRSYAAGDRTSIARSRWISSRPEDWIGRSICGPHVDLSARVLHIREAVYEGTFGTPKTEAGRRDIPLSEAAMQYIVEWTQHTKYVEPERLVFATRSGKPISPNNVLRRWIFPTCLGQGLPKATWLTFRRTYSTWAHQNGVPGKIVAQVMGHAKVDTTLNVYTQVLEGSVRASVE